ncbi:MAG: Hsp20/alpha crystallin family protein [Acidobacteriota bacterium]|nr:Hsp20/alpha crystallin family protein [Acidobacteriota bacterium]
MQDVNHALDEVKELYNKMLGKPAPEIDPASYLAFPPGVDPNKHVLDEVELLKRLSEQMAVAPRPTAWVPRADSFSTPDGLIVRLEIPGVARDDLKVFISGQECVVRGELKPPAKEIELQPLAIERPYGPFERRFMLPIGGNPERVTARYQDGILELRLVGEKLGAPQGTRIEVK